MPEGGVSGPAGCRLAPFRFGCGADRLRTGAPIVPLAIAGSRSCTSGAGWRRGSCRRRSRRALLGRLAGRRRPAEGSRAELELAHRLTERLAELLGPAVAELYRRHRRPARARPRRPARPDLAAPRPSAGRPLSGRPAILAADGVRRARSSTSSATRRSSASPGSPATSARPSASRSSWPSSRCSTRAARSRTGSACR